MRITSGEWKGFPLSYPKDRKFRPTQEKVRSAIFNVLQSRLEGSDFLDLYCGTGAMGFEAISRGAATVTMVDVDVRFAGRNRDASVARVASETQRGYQNRITLVRASARDYLKRYRATFDVIFMDPPWDQVALYEDTFRLLSGSDILRPDGVLICEHPKRLELTLPKGLAVGDRYSYSDTVVSMIYRQEVSDASSDLSREF